MSAKSTIEWLDGGATWNCVRGCTPIAPECGRCYARTFAERWRGIPGHAYEHGFDPRLVPESLDLPLRWRKWRRVFVNSMSDLFHDAVPDSFIDEVFARVLATRVFENQPRHEFIILTKRAERMRAYFSAAPAALLQRWAEAGDGRVIVGDGDEWFSDYVGSQCAAIWDEQGHATAPVEPWSRPELLFPLRGVRLGVSVGTRERRGELDHLKATPADSRMLSAEPLLEDLGDVDLRGIDWVIAGAESGPGARPMDEDWVRSLRDQCSAAGVPFFYKQRLDARGRKVSLPELDGRTWAEFPGSRFPSRTDKDNDAATEDTRG